MFESLPELLAAGDHRAPAIRWPGDPADGAMTRGELLDTVRRLAGQLRAAGVSKEDRVAFVLANGPEAAILFLAVSACCVAAPLNPKYRPDEVRFYVDDLKARAIIARGETLAALNDAVPETVQRLELTGPPEKLSLARDGVLLPASDPELNAPGDVALILHTSGTTARPKIVPLKHRNLALSADNIANHLQLNPDDCCLDVMPLFHIHGLVAGVLAPLTAGGTTVCPPGFDAFAFFDWFKRFQPTWYTAVPTMHQLVLGRAGRQAETIKAGRLRFARSSSAALPGAVMEGIEQAFDVPILQAYGMTEASHQIACNPLPPRERKAGSVGPGGRVDVAVMDQNGRLLPAGESGELVIKGLSVFGGYQDNPQANAAAFTDGWFRTGDEGQIDTDGYVFLTARLKEMINRGGEKVAPVEVEEVLLSYPGVTQAVVFAVPHRLLGEDVGAAIVVEPGHSVETKALRRYAAERLADHKLPASIRVLDELPKGPTGKLQRIGLAERLGITG